MKNNKGFLLVTAYLVIIVLLILGSAFLLRSVNENNLVRRQTMRKQAFYLAEAGLQRAHKGLRENWSGYTTELPRNSVFSQSFENIGSFTVDIENDPLPNTIKVTSKGTVGTVERTLEEIIKGTTGGGLPFDFAALAAGNLFLEGNASIENQDVYVNGNLEVHSPNGINGGDVYAKENVILGTGSEVSGITGNVNANGNITVNSGSTITGNATAAGNITEDGTITGDKISGAPDPVDETALAAKVESYRLSQEDWDNYKAQAQAAGTYHGGAFSPNGEYSGLHYVDGALTIADGASISGEATFVIAGSVQFNGGNIDLDPAPGNDYSLIIEKNVELPTGTSGTVGGVIYCEGNFNIGSFLTLEGAVICFGNLHASGNFSIEFPVAGTTLKVLSWRELYEK